MQFTPRSINVHENDPSSVSSYTLEIRTPGDELLARHTGLSADADGDTVLATGAFVAPFLGQTIRFWIQEVGPTGDVSAFQPCPSGDVLAFVVQQIPDGAEVIHVNI